VEVRVSSGRGGPKGRDSKKSGLRSPQLGVEAEDHTLEKKLAYMIEVPYRGHVNNPCPRHQKLNKFRHS